MLTSSRRPNYEENKTQKAAKDAENRDARAATILPKSLGDLCVIDLTSGPGAATAG
jgi:hypothetical protein